MNKTFRILQLINLLDHRRSVSLETIQKTCNIPERTVYRYLNTISEADIPIYFDPTERAYRLTRQGVLEVDDLSLGEAVIMTLALKLLAEVVGEGYQDEIDKLLSKVVVRQRFPIEEILPVIEHGLEDKSNESDLTELLSSLLVNAAISCRREVKLSRKNRPPMEAEVSIENPGWLFKNVWHLMEKGRSDKGETALSEISRVKIV